MWNLRREVDRTTSSTSEYFFYFFFYSFAPGDIVERIYIEEIQKKEEVKEEKRRL
jgi:hypothetical protein